MSQFFNFFFGIFKNHKLKLATFILSALVFGILLFPYGDIGNRVTSKILELTNNQVFLQFDDMGFSVIPQPGIKLKKVMLETPRLNEAITIGSLSLAPSITGLLSFKPGVSAEAEDLFGGSVQVSTRGAKDSNQHISVSASQIELAKAFGVLNLGMNSKGRVNLDGAFDIDPQMINQPDGSVTLSANSVEFSSIAIPVPMFGALTLPDMRFQKVSGDVTLKAGRLKLSKVVLGENGDALKTSISGEMEMRILSRGQQVELGLGDMNLEIDLSIQDALLKESAISSITGLFLDACNCKVTSPNGDSSWRFRLVSSNVMTEPPKAKKLE